MFDLATAAQATERDLTAIIGRLDGLADADWNTPVRCRGWQVADLAAHLAGASRGQAEALRRAAQGPAAQGPAAQGPAAGAVAGSAEGAVAGSAGGGTAGLARLAPPPERDPRSLLAALKDGQDRLLSALAEFPPAALEGPVPLPFGLLPAAVALQIVPLEYGFHRNDLAWALGDPVDLSPDMSATLLAIVPGLLPMLAAGSPVHDPGTRPSGPVSFRLVAPSARYLLSSADGGWSIAPDAGQAPVTCEISGGDSPVALFVMGRIDADHPSLTVSDPAAASTFKQYFPGP